MKKLFFVTIILAVLISGGFFYWKKTNTPNPKPATNVLSETDIAPSPSPSSWPESTILNIDGTSIRASWVTVEPKDVNLYSNLKDQHLSEQIKAERGCQILVNGGFYSKENTHLGLFTTNFETISQPIQNSTLNGFLWIDLDEKATISPRPSETATRLALQSGPLLIQDGLPLALKINNDEPSRRIVAAITQDSKLIFISFYKEQSDLAGPLLEDLPKVINLFIKQTHINIIDAINLDGGSHSTFISNHDLLREMTYIGSYFCIR